MDISCILAAIFFFSGNLLLLIFYAKEAQRDHYDYDLYKTLNPDYLQLEWEFRIDNRPLFLASGIINGFAWFFFCFPILQLTWILSHRGSRSLWLHIAVGVLALAGSFTEWIARFLVIGSSMASQMLVKKFNLENWLSDNSDDGIGWRALEVTHIVVSGLVWFIDAFEWLCIFFIMTLLYISVRRWRATDTSTFGGCWNSMGLFIALLSLLDFVAEILRLDGFKTFSQIAFWYAAVNRLILLPTWLILLSLSLPSAELKLHEDQNARGNAGNGAMTNGQVPTFTIGDQQQ
jgi:hypothetical protein